MIDWPSLWRRLPAARRKKVSLAVAVLLLAAGLGQIFRGVVEEIPFLRELSEASERVDAALRNIQPFAVYRHYRDELHPKSVVPADIIGAPPAPAPYCAALGGVAPRCRCDPTLHTTVCTPELGAGPFDVGAPAERPDCCTVAETPVAPTSAAPAALPQNPDIAFVSRQLAALKNTLIFVWRQDALTRGLLLISFALVVLAALALSVRRGPAVLLVAAVMSPLLVSVVAGLLLCALIVLNFVFREVIGFLLWIGGTLMTAYKLHEAAEGFFELFRFSVEGSRKLRSWLRGKPLS
jgi:hypothetical protein